jgi:hypothetical protein
MYKVSEETKGIPGDCTLQIHSDYGGYEECYATGNFCKIEGGKCPFDDDDIIQLEFKKTK